MARWDPGAVNRLQEAALDLFSEHGYEHVTVAQIAERAGLTRRSFSRYFPDKREVLFHNSGRLPALAADALTGQPLGLPAREALWRALVETGTRLTEYLPDAARAARRRAVIAASPELRERERSKEAAVAEALTTALVARGTPLTRARLLVGVGMVLFEEAFTAWTAGAAKRGDGGDERGGAAGPGDERGGGGERDERGAGGERGGAAGPGGERGGAAGPGGERGGAAGPGGERGGAAGPGDERGGAAGPGDERGGGGERDERGAGAVGRDFAGYFRAADEAVRALVGEG